MEKEPKKGETKTRLFGQKTGTRAGVRSPAGGGKKTHQVSGFDSSKTFDQPLLVDLKI